MKKFFAISLALAAAISSSADVKIELQGMSNDSVRVRMIPMQKIDAQDRIALDTIIVAEGGKATFDKVSEDCMLALGCMEKGEPGHTLFVSPGDEFFVRFKKGGDVEVSGSELQMEIEALMQKRKPIAAAIRDAKPEERDSLIVAYNNVYVDYVRANPNSPIALYILPSCGYKVIEEMLPKLGENAKKSMFAVTEPKLYAMVEHEKELAKATELTAEGNVAPEVMLNNPDGSAFVLSSLRGMYVVLDFWGSWCSWCVKGMPKMKEYYEKYGDKMEIVSIACGDTKERWLAAIKKHEMNWTNVISEDVVPGAGKKVENIYGVSGYPTKIIIDPQGKIVKRIVGESPEFYELLDKLLK